MIFKYNNKEIEVPDNFLIKCGVEAAKRDMTLEEYIAEAFTMLRKNEQSCGGTPEGWVSEEKFQEEWGYDANGSPIK
tara:strand:- start:549 stop:779 length:231 start_codon:yes stop_codon:yes gene_type:complete